MISVHYGRDSDSDVSALLIVEQFCGVSDESGDKHLLFVVNRLRNELTTKLTPQMGYKVTFKLAKNDGRLFFVNCKVHCTRKGLGRQHKLLLPALAYMKSIIRRVFHRNNRDVLTLDMLDNHHAIFGVYALNRAWFQERWFQSTKELLNYVASSLRFGYTDIWKYKGIEVCTANAETHFNVKLIWQCPFCGRKDLGKIAAVRHDVKKCAETASNKEQTIDVQEGVVHVPCTFHS